MLTIQVHHHKNQSTPILMKFCPSYTHPEQKPKKKQKTSKSKLKPSFSLHKTQKVANEKIFTSQFLPNVSVIHQINFRKNEIGSMYDNCSLEDVG